MIKANSCRNSTTSEKLIPSATEILQTMAAKYSGIEVEYILQNTGVKIYVDWNVFSRLSEY
jgi:hypothetical protein